MKQKVVSIQGKNIPIGIGIATICGMIVMLVGALILTWLLSTERIQEEEIGYGVMIISILSAVAASSTAIHHVRQYILPVSAGTCLCFAIVLLGTNALFFDGNYDGVGVTLLTILGTGIAVALIVLRYQNKPRNFRKKKING